MKQVVLLSLLLFSGAAAAMQPPMPPNPGPRPNCPPPSYAAIYPVTGQWYCKWPPHQGVTDTGYASTPYYVTHVVYAIPGKQSSIAYAAGDTVGATTSLTQSFNNTLDVKASTGVGFILPTAYLELSFTHAWGSTKADALDFSIETTDGYKKNGYSNNVNHDDDEVWFIASPRFRVDYTPYDTNYRTPQNITWSMVPDYRTESFYMYVGQLNGHYWIGQGVWDFLNYHGITAADFAEMLKADPFAQGSSPNMAMDPARFDLVGVFPYVPPGNADAPPNIQSHEVTRKLTNSSTTSSETSYGVGIKAGATISFIAHGAWSIEDKFKFTNSSSAKTSIGTNTKTTLSVGQPPYGYTGPTLLRVYEDKIWKTYVFQLDRY